MHKNRLVLLAAVLLALLAGGWWWVRTGVWFSRNWEATILDNGQEVTAWLFRIAGWGNRARVEVLASTQAFEDSQVTEVSGDSETLRVGLRAGDADFVLTVYGKPGDSTPQLLGNVQRHGFPMPVRLQPTKAAKIDTRKTVKYSKGYEALQRAVQVADAKDRIAAIKVLIDTYPGQPIVVWAVPVLLEMELRNTDKEGARAAAEKYLAVSAAYGPPVELSAAIRVAGAGLRKDRDIPLALDYARKAADLLPPDAPPANAVPILKLLARALRKGGKDGEAQEVESRLAKLEDTLDQEFARNAIPFPVEPYAGRAGKSDRVVLVELFTGAQCGPCIAADTAFDAALKAYKPSEVVLLQYHLHVPGPDPLTNSDSEARETYYGRNVVHGTPTVLLDGEGLPPPGLGGFRAQAQEGFELLTRLINDELEKPAGAQLKLTAGRTQGKIELAAEVSAVTKPDANLRLHFALVEDVVHYAGGNGQRLHHHVVRAFPGGVAGFEVTGQKMTKTVSLGTAVLRDALRDYLNEAAVGMRFPDENWPLKLEHLKAVAFVQDDRTKEVLQAAQADVPEK
jgi:hypothetical protein